MEEETKMSVTEKVLEGVWQQLSSPSPIQVPICPSALEKPN